MRVLRNAFALNTLVQVMPIYQHTQSIIDADDHYCQITMFNRQQQYVRAFLIYILIMGLKK